MMAQYDDNRTADIRVDSGNCTDNIVDERRGARMESYSTVTYCTAPPLGLGALTARAGARAIPISNRLLYGRLHET